MKGSRRWRVRIYRWSRRLAALLVLLVGGFLLLTRTGPGYRFLVGFALDRVNQALPGTLTVGEVSSAGILGGAMIRDIRFEDARGRPFVTADSLRASYSLLPLLARRLVLGPAEVWAPRVHIEQRTEAEGMNVFAAVGGGEPRPDSLPPRDPEERSLREFLIAGARIHDGEVILRFPAPEDGSEPSLGHRTTLDDGTEVTQWTFSDLQAVIPLSAIRTPDLDGEEFQIAALSGVADFLEEPIRIQDLAGMIRRLSGRVFIDASRVWLPNSEASGEATLDWSSPQALQASVELVADVVDTRDLGWLPFPLPPATGATRLSLRQDLEGLSVMLTQADLLLAGGDWGRARGDFGIATHPELTLRAVDGELDRVSTDVLSTWVQPAPLPSAGLTGSVRVNGPLRALQVDAQLALSDPRRRLGPTRGDARGVIHALTPLGATGFSLAFQALDYGWIRRFVPGSPFSGSGTLDLTVSGRAGEGFLLDGALRYGVPGAAPSRLSLEGTLAGSGPEAAVDLRSTLDPLSLDGLAEEFPALPLTGSLEGALEIRGTLAETTVSGLLDSPAGAVGVDLTLDLLDPARSYGARLVLDPIRLDGLVAGLPPGTEVRGFAEFAGRGLSVDSLRGDGRLVLGSSTVGPVDLDTLSLILRAGEGTLRADTLVLLSSLGDAYGTGSLGLAADGPPGRLNLEYEATSLAGIRPLVRGREVIARDTLNELTREALVMSGVDPDTLPLRADVRVDGRARGTLRLTGAVTDFDVATDLLVQDFEWGGNRVDGAVLDLTMEGLPGLSGRVLGQVFTDSLVLGNKRFRSGTADLDFTRPRGTLDVRLEKDRTEDYRARGEVEFEAGATQVYLDQLTLRFGEDRWNLGGPAGFRIQGDTVRIRDLTLLRQGSGGLRLEADGVLTDRGPSDFHLRAQRLDLGRVAGLLQAERALAGIVDLTLDVTGSEEERRVDGQIAAVGLEVEPVRFDTLLAQLSGSGGRLRGSVNGWEDGARVLEAAFDVPGVPSMGGLEEWNVPEPLEIRAEFTDFPLATLLSFTPSLERVQGLVNGEVTFGGTPRAVEPRGTLRVTGGEAYLPALNVTHRDASATAEFRPDRTVAISGTVRSGGRAEASGIIRLDEVTDPGFDLAFEARDFLALRRRDLSGTMTGRGSLTGTFQAPVVAGDIQIVRGELSLEEFVRSASVVSLTDPTIAIDDYLSEELLALRPVVIQSQNPFMENMRMDVSLGFEGGTWIRSRELDVEMGGDLTLLWDRQEESLVLTGSLNAIRGGYNNFGRRFDVQGGTVTFAGTPDLNPALSIETETRIRTTRGEPLEIQATVEGTLLEPRVSLSSDFQPPIAEADLVSYLLFGQPSYGLTEAGGGTVTAGVGFALGYLSSQIGSQLAQGIPFLDYVSVTARPEGSDGAAALATDRVLNTSVEGGVYVAEDLFLGFRIPLNTDPARNTTPDAWVEYAGWDPYRLELFAEDRFRRTVSSLGRLSFTTAKLWGFLVYREWGY